MTKKQQLPKYRILQPFGPKIAHFVLDTELVQELIQITDHVLADENRINYGFRLAGMILDEPHLPTEILQEKKVYNKIVQCHQLYIDSIFPRNNTKIQVKINTGWIVSQYENEYNPPHYHDGCSISSIIYLKIPEYTPRNIPGKLSRDGNIDFINKSSDPARDLEVGIFPFVPKVGDMLIFPSKLIHCVSPFLGPGERRSVSFNARHYKMKEK